MPHFSYEKVNASLIKRKMKNQDVNIPFIYSFSIFSQHVFRHFILGAKRGIIFCELPAFYSMHFPSPHLRRKTEKQTCALEDTFDNDKQAAAAEAAVTVGWIELQQQPLLLQQENRYEEVLGSGSGLYPTFKQFAQKRRSV
jgi:hypothetical protein